MVTRARRLLAVCVTTSMLSVSPTSAFAGHDLDWLSTSSQVSQVATSSLGVATAVGGVLTTVVACAALCRKTRRAYFDDNEARVRQGFALGGGDAIYDLMELYRIEESHASELGKYLRQNRAELLPLIYSAKDLTAFEVRLCATGLCPTPT